MRRGTVVLLVIAVGILPAQMGARQHGTATITGVVREAGTGAPVPFARVEVSILPMGTRMTLTDEDGRFRLDPPAGRYFVRAIKPPFAPAAYPDPSATGSRAFVLAPGAQFHVTLEMPKGAVITGRIVDEYGDPAVNQPIHLTGEQNGTHVGFPWGGPEFTGQYTTDARGRYRLFGLPPGEYVVYTAPYADDRMQNEWRRAGRVPTYYSNVTDRSQATKIVLRAGEERTGVDFALRSVPMFNVRGSISSSFPIEGNHVIIRLLDSEFGYFRQPGSHQVPADGRFTIDGVGAGTYHVVATATTTALTTRRQPRRSLWATAAIAVGGGDVDGVTLVLQPALSVSGRVIMLSESPPESPVQSIAVWLEPTPDTQAVFDAAPVSVEASGVFDIDDLSPGRYRVQIRDSSLQGLVVATVTVRGRPIRDGVLHLTADLREVVVGVRKRE